MGLKSFVARLKGSEKKKAPVDATARSMQGVNPYWRKLSPGEIAAGVHRTFVGGEWERIGALQFAFLKDQGLEPGHKLIDVGCGALRGGKHFVRYLERGNYFGLDINESLIEAGKKELEAERLLAKEPRLLANDRFEAFRFGESFDFGIAVSLFTHLYMNHILRCLVEVRKVLEPSGRFFASFFEAPSPVHLDRITHELGGFTTNFDANPFHYSFGEMEDMARRAGLRAERIGDFGHPRSQKMACFLPA